MDGVRFKRSKKNLSIGPHTSNSLMAPNLKELCVKSIGFSSLGDKSQLNGCDKHFVSRG